MLHRNAFKYCESLLSDLDLLGDPSDTIGFTAQVLGHKMFEAVLQVIEDNVQEDVDQLFSVSDDSEGAVDSEEAVDMEKAEESHTKDVDYEEPGTSVERVKVTLQEMERAVAVRQQHPTYSFKGLKRLGGMYKVKDMRTEPYTSYSLWPDSPCSQ